MGMQLHSRVRLAENVWAKNYRLNSGGCMGRVE
jgi:hypothetical protein